MKKWPVVNELNDAVSKFSSVWLNLSQNFPRWPVMNRREQVEFVSAFHSLTRLGTTQTTRLDAQTGEMNDWNKKKNDH